MTTTDTELDLAQALTDWRTWYPTTLPVIGLGICRDRPELAYLADAGAARTPTEAEQADYKARREHPEDNGPALSWLYREYRLPAITSAPVPVLAAPVAEAEPDAPEPAASGEDRAQQAAQESLNRWAGPTKAEPVATSVMDVADMHTQAIDAVTDEGGKP